MSSSNGYNSNSLFALEQTLYGHKHPSQPSEGFAAEEPETPDLYQDSLEPPPAHPIQAQAFDWDEAIALDYEGGEAQAFDWDEAIALEYEQAEPQTSQPFDWDEAISLEYEQAEPRTAQSFDWLPTDDSSQSLGADNDIQTFTVEAFAVEEEPSSPEPPSVQQRDAVPKENYAAQTAYTGESHGLEAQPEAPKSVEPPTQSHKLGAEPEPPKSVEPSTQSHKLEAEPEPPKSVEPPTQSHKLEAEPEPPKSIESPIQSSQSYSWEDTPDTEETPPIPDRQASTSHVSTSQAYVASEAVPVHAPIAHPSSPPQTSAAAFDFDDLESSLSAMPDTSDAEAFAADVAAILRGEKTYEPAAAHQPTSPPAPAKSTPQAPSKLQSQAQALPPKPPSAHDVFDQMGRSMTHATAFDLGTFSLEQTFDEFDAMLDEQERGRSFSKDADEPKAIEQETHQSPAIAQSLEWDEDEIAADVAALRMGEPWQASSQFGLEDSTQQDDEQHHSVLAEVDQMLDEADQPSSVEAQPSDQNPAAVLSNEEFSSPLWINPLKFSGVLTDRDFREALHRSTPRISVRRALLYEPQLTYAKQRLAAIATNPAYHATNLTASNPNNWKFRLQFHRNARRLDLNYNVFAKALTGTNLDKLILNLAQQVDPWAAYFIRYTKDSTNNAAIHNAGTYEDLVNAILDNHPFTIPGDVARFPNFPNAVSKSIERITHHFIHNFETACQRIFNNWNDLNQAFSPHLAWMLNTPQGQPAYPIFEQVERLIPTGSDYHKGGQQVMLVDFAIVPGRICASKRTNQNRLITNATQLEPNEYCVERVVYKPGDVELDCRMVGNTAIVNAIQPTGYQQPSSMSEVINGFLNRPLNHSLPTYVILPYHSGSRLIAAGANWAAVNAPVIDIRQSYGYIQFLTHNPDLEQDLRLDRLNPSLTQFANALARYTQPNWIADSDYITDNPNHKLDYFLVWGQLMAMCVTFSMSDFHSQNTIVHRVPGSIPKPHLIDLEDGFKWPMDKVDHTQILSNNLNKPTLTERKLAVVYDKDLRINAFHNAVPTEYQKNQCFDFIHNIVYRQKPNPETRRVMCEGFLAVVESFRNNHVVLNNWLGNLGNTVTRFVPVPTGEFYKQMLKYATESLPLQDCRYEQVRITRNADETGWNAQNTAAGTDPVKLQWTKSHPFYSLDYQEHNFYDFDNRDVPYYVHVLGHRELLNSRGWKVDVQQGYNWQQHAGIPHLPALINNTGRTNALGAPLGPGNINEYFPDTAMNVVQNQLLNLTNHNFFPRVTSMLEEILRVPGIVNNNSMGEDVADPGDVVPVGNITLDGQVVVNGGNVQFRVPGYHYEWDAAGAGGWHWRVTDPANHGQVVYQA